MKNRIKVGILTVLLSVGMVAAEASMMPAPSIVITPIASPSAQMLSFSVGIHNPSEKPFELNTNFSDVVTYQLGGYSWQKNMEGLVTKNYIVMGGETKVIRYFNHDLKANPSPNAEKANIKVYVEGVGEASYSFELSKPPSFFDKVISSFRNATGTQNVQPGSDLLQGQDQGELARGLTPPGTQGRFQQNRTSLNSTALSSTRNTNASNANNVLGLESLNLSSSEQSATSSPATTANDQNTTSGGDTSKTAATGAEPASETQGGDSGEEAPSENASQSESSELSSSEVPTQAPVSSGGSGGGNIVSAPADNTSADTTPPSMPSVNSFPHTVNATSMTLSGTKDANTSIWLSNAHINLSFIEYVPLDAETTWSFEAPLAEGVNIMRVMSKDAAGNESISRNISPFRDTIAPTFGSVLHQGITENSAKVSVQVDEAVTLRLDYNDGSNVRSVTSDLAKHTHEGLLLAPLQSATNYTYNVTATDKVGHVTTSATYNFNTATSEGTSTAYFEDPLLMPSLTKGQLGGSLWGRYHALDDLNGDGIAEFAIVFRANNTTNERLDIAYSSPDGTYQPENMVAFSDQGLVTSNHLLYFYPVGDLNGDGYQDLVLNAHEAKGPSPSYNDRAQLLLSNTTSDPQKVTFEISQTLYHDADAARLEARLFESAGHQGDFNGDGIVDLILRVGPYDPTRKRENYKMILSNVQTQSYESFASSKTIQAIQRTAFPVVTVPFAFSDMNGDGSDDLAISFSSAWPSEKTQRVFLSPNFDDASSVEIHAAGDVDVRSFYDYDGDGLRELILNPKGTQLDHLVRFNQDGSIRDEEDISYRYSMMSIPDMNGDGHKETLSIEAYNQARIYFSSEGGGVDLTAEPSITMNHDETMLGNIPQPPGHFAVRSRVEKGVTKHDLLYGVNNAELDDMAMILYKQK